MATKKATAPSKVTPSKVTPETVIAPETVITPETVIPAETVVAPETVVPVVAPETVAPVVAPETVAPVVETPPAPVVETPAAPIPAVIPAEVIPAVLAAPEPVLAAPIPAEAPAAASAPAVNPNAFDLNVLNGGGSAQSRAPANGGDIFGERVLQAGQRQNPNDTGKYLQVALQPAGAETVQDLHYIASVALRTRITAEGISMIRAAMNSKEAAGTLQKDEQGRPYVTTSVRITLFDADAEAARKADAMNVDDDMFI